MALNDFIFALTILAFVIIGSCAYFGFIPTVIPDSITNTTTINGSIGLAMTQFSNIIISPNFPGMVVVLSITIAIILCMLSFFDTDTDTNTTETTEYLERYNVQSPQQQINQTAIKQKPEPEKTRWQELEIISDTDE